MSDSRSIAVRAFAERGMIVFTNRQFPTISKTGECNG